MHCGVWGIVTMRTTPPSKIEDFAHLPLHRGGFPLRYCWWLSLHNKKQERNSSPVIGYFARHRIRLPCVKGAVSEAD